MNKLDLIKERELEILKEFKKVCDNNNIKYFLGFGTLLGAVRHKGFIPWDDDIDIMMTRKEYNRFLKCSKELSSKVFFQNNSTDSFRFGIFLTAKLRDNNSKVEFDVDHHQGIFIDMFVIDQLSSKRKYILLRYLESIEYDLNYFNRHPMLKILSPFRWIIKKIKVCERMRKNYLNSSVNYNSKYFMYWGKSMEFDVKDIYPTKELMFEGIPFPVPNNYIKFLELLYGDWKTLPSVEKRVASHINLKRAIIK